MGLARTGFLTLAIPAWIASGSAVNAQSLQPTVSIRDAISMVRIPSSRSPVATFSPDGSRFASVVWRGDLGRRTNVYDLLLFDVLGKDRRISAPRRVLSLDYPGDSLDQQASAIAQITILPDNQTIVFLGRMKGRPVQVYSVDATSGRLRQLTKHRSDVVAYALDALGEVRVYSALMPDPSDTGRVSRLLGDGVFLSNPAMYWLPPLFQNVAGNALYAERPSLIREYLFFQPSDRGRSIPRKLFDTRDIPRARAAPMDAVSGNVAKALMVTSAEAQYSVLNQYPTFLGSPSGRYAIVFPHSFADRDRYLRDYPALLTAWRQESRYVASAYGLMDLQTGTVERLVDAPREVFVRGGGAPVWSSDGRSVLIHSFLPLEGDSAARASRARAPSQWVEIELATRRATPLNLPSGWKAARWIGADSRVIAFRFGALGSVRKRSDGSWGEFREIGTSAGFNGNYEVSSNGSIIVGVTDSLLRAPEFTAYDLETKRFTVLTDLNPDLRRRRYGETTTITWRTPYDSAASGYLVKPVGYRAGTRYPLAILLNIEGHQPGDYSFILDAHRQLSAFAIQTLAAGGVMVLLAPDPPSFLAHAETPRELQLLRTHIESAISHLNALGLIDSTRVSLSGWSRGGFHTEAILIHSRFPFAAASKVDGGGAHYLDGGRPWWTDELRRVRTPLLIEAHGRDGVAYQGPMYDQLRALGKPAELLLIRGAPHDATNPLHRGRSLQAHTDWLRFWLQGYEDPDPSKREQYQRWRAMRHLATSDP
jgi:dienelactone hydrolase